MSRLRKQTRLREVMAENQRLRAKLLAAHDHLHNDRMNELHESLHCPSSDEAEEVLSTQNVSVDSASRMAEFSTGFNRLCAEYRVLACWVAHVPSAVKLGFVSVQMGGSVDVINWTRGEMGLAPTHAIGDH